MKLAAMLSRRRLYLLLAAGVLLLDQVTKILAHAFLRGRGATEIVPGFFNLTYSRNPGGLFGYLGDLADPWRSVVLTLVPLVAIGMILGFLLRGDENDRPTLLGLGLILGGAVGNLIDRLVRGEVVDFLDVYAAPGRVADWLIARFDTAHWPTFNVADSAIVVGAGLLIVSILRPHPTTRAAGPVDPSAAAGSRDAV